MGQTASITVGKPDREVWIACGTCGRVTCHKVLTVVELTDSSSGDEITVWKKFMTVICQGCRTVSFCVESTCTEDVAYDARTGQYLAPSYRLYPSRAAGHLEMASAHHLPAGIYRVYQETRARPMQRTTRSCGHRNLRHRRSRLQRQGHHWGRSQGTNRQPRNYENRHGRRS